ncbi:hypothetical protein FBUS_04066 [Fasciolopsis buskii]|uniref:Uncharacterized protein n=1 Tax=Fasciolopsis buskii TaxID=27845 RepID=A0A8E0SB83_9TREM|nr:hypothetical protein FBUS_04066 [Fasciolopsis buski]
MESDREESVLTELSSPGNSAIKRSLENVDVEPGSTPTYASLFSSPAKVARMSTQEQIKWSTFREAHSGLISDNLKSFSFPKAHNQPVNQLLMTATFWNNLSVCIRHQQQQQQQQQTQLIEKIHPAFPPSHCIPSSVDDAECSDCLTEDNVMGSGIRMPENSGAQHAEEFTVANTTAQTATSTSLPQLQVIPTTSANTQETALDEKCEFQLFLILLQSG